jgi:hypothetical protein
MSRVHAVLLVPEKGDPHGLLAYGPCGARPPMAVRRTYPRVVHESNEWGDPTYNGEKCVACDQPWPCETPGKVESEGHVRWQPGNPHTTVADALVLAWDGEPVWQGTEVVQRAAPAWLEPGDVEDIVGAHLRGVRSVVPVLLSRLGTFVLLDAEGREVSDE